MHDDETTVTGQDPRGVVTATVDLTGRPAGLEISSRWDDVLEPEELGAAVLSAVHAALGHRPSPDLAEVQMPEHAGVSRFDGMTRDEIMSEIREMRARRNSLQKDMQDILGCRHELASRDGSIEAAFSLGAPVTLKVDAESIAGVAGSRIAAAVLVTLKEGFMKSAPDLSNLQQLLGV